MRVEVVAAPDTGWWLWRLLFPARCLGCGHRGFFLCPPCGARLPLLSGGVCPRCCALSARGRVCLRCERTPTFLASSRAACAFEGVVRKAVHAFKYQGRLALAPLLTDLLVRALETRPVQADLIVPVPLHPSRERERGYNQAEVLARGLSSRTGLSVRSTLLARNRPTRPQIHLKAAERQANLRDAFVCPEPSAVSGRAVLLLDDVTTTGATLRACADVLGAAGAARVMAIVVAKEL